MDLQRHRVQYAYYRACYGADPVTGFWDQHFATPENIARVVCNSDIRSAITSGSTFDKTVSSLKLTTPSHFALAATYGELQVVAERIGGVWRDTLTRP